MAGNREERIPTPFVTYALLASIVFVQIYLTISSPSQALDFYDQFSLVPAYIMDAVQVDTLITYMFLHGNLVHLIMNGITLYGSGIIVERDIGHVRFLMVFLASGMLAGLIHSMLNPSLGIPLVGSSGAVFGVIAVLLLLMPFKLTYALVVPLPSVIVGIMLSLVELSALYMTSDISVAHDVHLSGFIIGGICAFFIDRKRALRGLFIATAILVIIYYLGIYFNVLPATPLAP